MDILLPGIVTIIILHFIADFILQTHEMATMKSSSNWMLSAHVLMYMTPFGFMVFIFENVFITLAFILFNGAAHFVVDYFSSRAAKYYRERNEWHSFFVVIGADQALHMLTLIVSFVWFLGVWPIFGF